MVASNDTAVQADINPEPATDSANPVNVEQSTDTEIKSENTAQR